MDKWLTPQVRFVIYMVVFVAMVALLAFQIVTADQLSTTVDKAALLVAALVNLLAAANVPK